MEPLSRSPVLLSIVGHNREVNAARTHRRLHMLGMLEIRHYPDAAHSIERTSRNHDQASATLGDLRRLLAER